MIPHKRNINLLADKPNRVLCFWTIAHDVP